MYRPSSVSNSSAILAIAILAIAMLATVKIGSMAVAAELVQDNELIAIPAGTFVFGRDGGRDNEAPERKVGLPTFRMLRTEVTNDQYKSFASQTGRRFPAYARHPVLGLGAHPVVGVTWEEADAFCRHHGLVLPSEQEYERAARGLDGDAFPWGNQMPEPERVNRGTPDCCGGDDRDGHFWTAPVGTFPYGESAEGIADLIGNAWEWTRDWYAPYDGLADPNVAVKFKVLRGGSWSNGGERLSATYRLAYDPEFRFAANGGFRCVTPTSR